MMTVYVIVLAFDTSGQSNLAFERSAIMHRMKNGPTRTVEARGRHSRTSSTIKPKPRLPKVRVENSSAFLSSMKKTPINNPSRVSWHYHGALIVVLIGSSLAAIIQGGVWVSLTVFALDLAAIVSLIRTCET
jgi:hypothetical protein